MRDEADGIETQVVESNADRRRQVRAALTLREFDLPPIGDGVLIGRRAAIGPRGLFEAIDRMLPGQYQLVSVEHPTTEGVIFRTSKTKAVPQDKLVALFLRQGEALMSETTILRVDVDFEVRLWLEVEP